MNKPKISVCYELIPDNYDGRDIGITIRCKKQERNTFYIKESIENLFESMDYEIEKSAK